MKKLFGAMITGATLLTVSSCGVSERDALAVIRVVADEKLPNLMYASRIDYEAWSSGIALPSEIDDVYLSYEVVGNEGEYENTFTIENNVLYYAIDETGSDDYTFGSGTELKVGVRVKMDYKGYVEVLGFQYENFAYKKLTNDDLDDIPVMVESATPHYVDGNPYITIVPDLDGDNGWRLTNYSIGDRYCATYPGVSGWIEDGLVDGEPFEYTGNIECTGNMPGASTFIKVEYTIERYHPAKPEIYRVYGEIYDKEAYPITWPSA